MKKLLLILALILISLTAKAQVIKQPNTDEECYEDYKPCTECFEGVEKWQSAKPNNTSQQSNSLNNKNALLNKAATTISRPVKVAAAVVGSVLMAIFIVKLTSATNAITTQQ